MAKGILAGALLLMVGCASAVSTGGGLAEKGGAVKYPPAMDGIDAGRTGRVEAHTGVDLLGGHRIIDSIRPVDDGKSGEAAAPLVVGGTVYVGNAARALNAVDWRTGKLLWSKPFAGQLLSSPAYADGRLFAADTLGKVRALTLEGETLWEADVKFSVAAPLLVAESRVFVFTQDQNLYCFDQAKGTPLWRYESRIQREGTVWRGSAPAIYDGVLYLGLSEGEVAALDAQFGRLLWKKTVSDKSNFPDITAGPLAKDGLVYVGSLSGNLTALKAKTGEEAWRVPVRAVGGLAADAERLFVGTDDGGLMAVALADGKTLWTAKLDGGVAAPPLSAGSYVYVGATEGSYFKIDAKDGRILSTRAPGGGIQGRGWAGDLGAAFLSNGGVLHLFNRER